MFKFIVALLLIFPFSTFSKIKDIGEPISYILIEINNLNKNNNLTILSEKNSSTIRSIASITKLMTAIVFLENLKPNQPCSISFDKYHDTDIIKKTRFKLLRTQPVNCDQLLKVMLIGSDNNAAMALSRSLPGIKRHEFIELMNKKAQQLNMKNTNFVDPAGLSPRNISTSEDLLLLAAYALNLPEISNFSKQAGTFFINDEGQIQIIENTNKLISKENYKAKLSKTGYIRESKFNLIYVPDLNCVGYEYIFVVLGAPTQKNRSEFIKNQLSKLSCKN